MDAGAVDLGDPGAPQIAERGDQRVQVGGEIGRRARQGERLPVEEALEGPRAHDLGLGLGHPVYDLVYVALAERLVSALRGTRWAHLVEALG